MITQDYLKSILSYSEETGLFFWRINVNKVKIGQVTGSVDRYGYIRIGINHKNYAAHRLAWLYVYGDWPKHSIDHINNNRKDNRIENLRDCEFINNSWNRRPAQNNPNSIVGVNKRVRSDGSHKWRARIKVNGKNLCLGQFDNYDDAVQARLDGERKYYGSFSPNS